MSEKISPEERLFKVIQQGKQASPGGVKGPGKFDEWLRGIKHFIFYSRKEKIPGGKKFDWKIITLRLARLRDLEPSVVNNILAFVLAAIVIVVILVLAGKKPDITKIGQVASRMQASSVNSVEGEPLKEQNFYLDEIRKRDIFHPLPKGAVSESLFPEGDALKKAAAGLKLQGISWGEDRPKAMILMQDDKDKEGKMYFLSAGQTIGTTGIKVKAIYKNKVVISYGDKEMELL